MKDYVITTEVLLNYQMWERSLLNRFFRHFEDRAYNLESQGAFCASRGTVDMISALKQMQEKCQKQTSI